MALNRRRGDHRAGVAGRDDRVDLAGGHQAPALRDRVVPLLAQRLDRLLLHADRPGSRERSAGGRGARPGAWASSASIRSRSPTRTTVRSALVADGLDGSGDDRAGGVVAPHRVQGNPHGCGLQAKKPIQRGSGAGKRPGSIPAGPNRRRDAGQRDHAPALRIPMMTLLHVAPRDATCHSVPFCFVLSRSIPGGRARVELVPSRSRNGGSSLGTGQDGSYRRKSAAPVSSRQRRRPGRLRSRETRTESREPGFDQDQRFSDKRSACRSWHSAPGSRVSMPSFVIFLRRGPASDPPPQTPAPTITIREEGRALPEFPETGANSRRSG